MWDLVPRPGMEPESHALKHMEFQPLDHQGSPLVLFLWGSVSTELFLLHTYIFLNFYFEVTSFIGSCKNSRERPLFQFPLWFPSITRGLCQRQASNSGARCARRAPGPSVPRVTPTASETRHCSIAAKTSPTGSQVPSLLSCSAVPTPSNH